VPTIRRSLSGLAPLAAYLAFGVVLLVVHASLELGSTIQSLTHDFVGASVRRPSLPPSPAPGVIDRTVDDLLGNTDIAMCRAKAQGKGRYHVFRESDPAALAERDQTWLERGPTVRRRDAMRLVEPRLEPRAG
jgi:hypothetical protein